MPSSCPVPVGSGTSFFFHLRLVFTSFQHAFLLLFCDSVPLPMLFPWLGMPLKWFFPSFKTQLKTHSPCETFPGFSGPRCPLSLTFHYVLQNWTSNCFTYFSSVASVIFAGTHSKRFIPIYWLNESHQMAGSERTFLGNWWKLVYSQTLWEQEHYHRTLYSTYLASINLSLGIKWR